MTTTGKTRKAGLEFAVHVGGFGSMKPRARRRHRGRAETRSCAPTSAAGAGALRERSDNLSVVADISHDRCARPCEQRERFG